MAKTRPKRTAKKTGSNLSGSSNSSQSVPENDAATSSKQQRENHDNCYSDKAATYLQIVPDTLQHFMKVQTQMMDFIKDLTIRIVNLEEALINSNADRSKQLESIKKECTLTQNAVKKLIPQLTAPSTGSCTEDPNAKLSKEVVNILMKEKKQQKTKEECRKIKESISLKWDETLKIRDKHFRNFVKNEQKAMLYEKWAASSPSYIPYKYRPKKIPGETAQYTAARIQEARLRYSNDCKLIKTYATTHRERYTNLDKEMSVLFESLISNEDQLETLIELWNQDNKPNEKRAYSLWSKNESFLNRKKHEDELKNEVTLSPITWTEKLCGYGKNRRKIANHEEQHTTAISFDQQHGTPQYYYPPYYYSTTMS